MAYPSVDYESYEEFERLQKKLHRNVVRVFRRAASNLWNGEYFIPSRDAITSAFSKFVKLDPRTHQLDQWSSNLAGCLITSAECVHFAAKEKSLQVRVEHLDYLVKRLLMQYTLNGGYWNPIVKQNFVSIDLSESDMYIPNKKFQDMQFLFCAKFRELLPSETMCLVFEWVLAPLPGDDESDGDSATGEQQP